MKASSGFRGWRALVGVLSLSVFAFCMSLEGAPRPWGSKAMKSGSAPGDGKTAIGATVHESTAQPGAERVVSGTSFQTLGRDVRLGRIASELPVLPEDVVNYLDDDMTRARPDLTTGELKMPE